MKNFLDIKFSWFFSAIVTFVSLTFLGCLAHVETELVFDKQMIWNEKKSDGSDSDVMIVQSSEQFSKEAINNKKPVIIKISSQKNTTLKVQFQSLAEQIPAVDFICMDLSVSGELIRAIMMKAQVSQISIPFFLFFKDGSLIHIRSYDTGKKGENKTKEAREKKLREIESDLKKLIKKRFFESPIEKKKSPKPNNDSKKPLKDKPEKPEKIESEGFWQKLQSWKKWILG
jgi:hypothetical protein